MQPLQHVRARASAVSDLGKIGGDVLFTLLKLTCDHRSAHQVF